MMLRTYSEEFYLRRTSSGELNLGSPLSNAAIRQRHNQGYASNDEDAEDGACSETSSYSSMPITLRPHTWTDIFQNVIWIVSAAFIVYLGDCNTNLVSILLWDERIKRMALYLGLIGSFLNVGIILHAILSLKYSWTSEKYKALPPTAPAMAFLGIISFCLFSYALWPVWNFLTIPLVITLFMTFMVVSPYRLHVPRYADYAVPRAD
ncbi:MFS general substrate transporter domain-containing protein [Dioscorea alata]|uniref:MFS general substrate transporter domain-containing protein n=3 Tax=Dioscorea alata TaxID=55571 RepID=A0ACB7UA73_DIOAL|nr:MFS general substrate transporter domain-containing protein [Dioscorea alata]KAH7657172.1 MFS general substrate transporter domain-containing protein [Dioscorea alata]KAH7657173.1 MFS general substrate transporter domain-containing protein [Dioscorea alata]